jgi:nitrite reductase (NADH) small subunit
MTRTRALKVSDLPEESKKILEINGFEIALFHLNRKIHAISNICPHNGGSLGEGFVVGETVVCPLHSWKFNLVTGKSSNQTAYCIEIFPVEIIEEWIYLDLPEEDIEE